MGCGNALLSPSIEPLCIACYTGRTPFDESIRILKNDWIGPVNATHPLRDDTVRLLQRFTAAQTEKLDTSFQFRPIKGNAFAWILHPGFYDGTRMTGLPALHELEQAGFLVFEQVGFPTRQTTFWITEAGMSHAKGIPANERQPDAGMQQIGGGDSPSRA